MEDIQLSTLLAELIVSAAKVGPGSHSPITAERFMIAAIDEITKEPAPKAGSERDTVKQMIYDAFADPAISRDALYAYVSRENKMAFLDDLYMKRKLNEAKEQSRKTGGQELSADVLLLCIFRNPSEAVKGAMSPKAIRTVASPKTENGTLADLLAKSYHADGKKQDKKEDTSVDEMTTLTDDTDEIQMPWDIEVPDHGGKQAKDLKRSQMAELIGEVKNIRTSLQNVIFGQDNAINVFATGYFQASMLSMMDKSRKRPRATFLFAGPPGVGKTFMAEQVAEVLGLPFCRFDMSEYADKESNIEFCGSDKVYKNGKAGNVTSFVAENPHCVLLFDEIEKAHITVIHLFLQMLDAGRLRDNYTDKEVLFNNALIIMTTNAGKQLYQDSETTDLSTVSRKVIIKALENDKNPETGVPYFPGAICSRFASGNVVMFNHIAAHNLRAIAQREIQRHAGNLERETGIRMEIDEHVYTALLFAEGSTADARTVRSRGETFFNDELYELMRFVASDKVKTGIEQIENIHLKVDLEGAPKNICEMFCDGEKPLVLMFADPNAVSMCRGKVPEFEIIGVQSVDEAVQVLKKQDVDLVLLDPVSGEAAAEQSLNIEDVVCPARDFFHYLKEHNQQLPIYLLEQKSRIFSEEEKVSFMRQGVRGVLRIAKWRDTFAEELRSIAGSLHQQKSMTTLAKANKLIQFETAQTISKNGKSAEIRLFDFRMGTAVDSEDSKNILSAVSKPDVRFEDVIGACEAKKELSYFVEYLKNPKKYMGTGVKAPKGVLLYGPPGTGKTLLAKAMATEADVTFIAAEGNQFLKKYVGEGSEKVHELFRTARKYAPAILFVDEIDAIAKERKGGPDAGSNGEETLTAFLTEMDGFTSDPTRPVFVLAATNFDVEPGKAKSLDSALMRRFDRKVFIDLPNKAERIQFLQMKIRKNPALEISQEKIESLALRATGMSLAELDSAVELALRSAIREGSTKVTDEILDEAFETFHSGEEKKWDISQLERVARHEAGHAFLCWHSGQTPSYLTIVARGSHGGYMQHAEQEGKAIYTCQELLGRIRTSLGGRAAEIVYYGKEGGISTGASGDLASATNLARNILCTYGMDDEFGLAVLDRSSEGPLSGEVRAAVNRILKEQMEQTVAIITENKAKIDALVEELMSKNHMTGAEIQAVLSGTVPADKSKAVTTQ